MGVGVVVENRMVDSKIFELSRRDTDTRLGFAKGKLRTNIVVVRVRARGTNKSRIFEIKIFDKLFVERGRHEQLIKASDSDSLVNIGQKFVSESVQSIHIGGRRKFESGGQKEVGIEE